MWCLSRVVGQSCDCSSCLSSGYFSLLVPGHLFTGPLSVSRTLLHVLSMMFMKENQNQFQSSPSTVQADTASLLSCAILQSNPQDEGSMHEEHHRLPQQAPNDPFSFGGSSSHHVEDNHHQMSEQCSVKWMSSKMRLMRKMLKQRRTEPLHDQARINRPTSTNDIKNNSNNDTVRVCSNCKTTKTPLWRGGPQGPKSLCNACGIRQMKARRAMRAAVGLSNCKMQQKERSDKVQTAPFKKRFKLNVTTSSSQTNLRFDDMLISLRSKLAIQQSLPQEEKDAAILLMALSCGLVHG